jgi:hypothetical protein
MLESQDSDFPRCVALLICSEVIEDKRTNNKTLINVFNTITTSQLPAVQNKTVLLISVTNATGDHELTVDLLDPEGGNVVSVNLHVNSHSPFAIHDLVLELLAVPLNHAGNYSFEVSIGGRQLGARQFNVLYQPTTPAQP